MYDDAGGDGEAAIQVIDEQIIGDPGKKSTWGSPSILEELQISRSEYDGLPEGVKRIMVDYKFNTGRSVKDLIAIANKEGWSGRSAFDGNVTWNHNDEAALVDLLTNMDVKELNTARKDLYKGRYERIIESSEGTDYPSWLKGLPSSHPLASLKGKTGAMSDDDKKKIKAYGQSVKDQYDNSQQYRI